MNRIIVVGSPGAGKSTFAKKLANKLNLPLYHLDNIFWNSDQTTVTEEDFDRQLAKILKEDRWLLDGNYQRSLNQRLAFCDTVFYLDYPVDLCLESVIQRRGKRRSDLPWIEPADINNPEFQEFLQYIRDFPKDKRPELEALLAQYRRGKLYRFTHRQEAEKFLHDLER